MPSKSPAQARLMAAAAHTPGGYDGVPQSVGREFNQADKGTGMIRRKHASGGMVSGAEDQPPDAPPQLPPQPLSEHPRIKAIMDIARAASFAQPKASESEDDRRKLGRTMSIGIRG